MRGGILRGPASVVSLEPRKAPGDLRACLRRSRATAGPQHTTYRQGMPASTRTLTRWVAWAACPPCRRWGLAAHRRLNTASRRAQQPGPRLPVREKTRPAAGLQRHFREKLRPARQKTPILGHFSCAGRTFSRSQPPSGRAGRTFSRAARRNMATMKPTTPLLTPNKAPLKPTTPLRPKNAPKTPISRPQKRRWFQTHTGTSEQRRWRFQTTGPSG